MTSRQAKPPRDREFPDFRRLPESLDLSTVVETHDVDPDVHEPESPFATPDIEAMSRTAAIGGGF